MIATAPRNPRAARLALAALLLAGLALRAIPWLANLPLHHDEALYGTWARAIADGSDPLLLNPWLDKPPLVLYLLGLSLKLFGTSELSLRVPGMVASVLTVWATLGLARRVTGAHGAWAAAALVALSPFAILFAPTAFTDGWLTLFIVAAAWAALARRPGWAGALLGLACASKQQGVLAVPLVLGLLVVAGGGLDRKDPAVEEEHETRKVQRLWAALAVALIGFVAVFGAVTYWDSLRWHNRPSYWDQSLQTYGGVGLAPLAEWPKRAAQWAELAGYWFGAWPVTMLLLGAAVAGAALAHWERGGREWSRTLRLRTTKRPVVLRSGCLNSGGGSGCSGSSGSVGFDSSGSSVGSGSGGARAGFGGSASVVLVYVLGYLLVHVAVTFQPWDRYLLPILPLVCVVCGGGIAAAWDYLRSSTGAAARRWAVVGLSGLMLYATVLGVTASIPIGSDIGAYHGVAAAAKFLIAQPPGTTVYYDRIGWLLGYYLYDRPITRSWYDSPAKLASEAARVARERASGPQWLALPAWEASRLPALGEALAAKGFVAEPAYEVTARDGSPELTLYRLGPSPSEIARRAGAPAAPRSGQSARSAP